MMKRIFIAVLCLSIGISSRASDVVTNDFRHLGPVIDSLLRVRTSVSDKIKIKKVVLSKDRLDIDLGSGISNFPLRPYDISWLRDTLKEMLPEKYKGKEIGELLCGRKSISSLVVAAPGNDGNPAAGIRSDGTRGPQVVSRGVEAKKGLVGRNIALWQSHGYYYNNQDSTWRWQRPVIFQIVEDLFTQSFVVPFLVPMLENAGANVFMPRERDWHSEEIIIDNDRAEDSSGRIHGEIVQSGKWDKGVSGFADTKPCYTDGESPFYMGSFLARESTKSKNKASRISWVADIPSDGEYAVYVTYPMLPNACSAVQYTVHTSGGDFPVTVNQSIGGGVWEYLGTYGFSAGRHALVSISNWSREKGTVSADAVRIGGGMGCIARPSADSSGFAVSGKPRFAEAARYFLQWSGFPDKVWNQNEGGNDYRDDIMCRGAWVRHLLGGSRWDRDGKGLGIPIDASLAWHTDAGTFPNDSIVGTLAIYTLKCENSEKFANGESRRACREITDFIQTEVTDAIRSSWDSRWTRRQIWNRSYSESRTTGVPAILLELLSHQNFEDMKYGLDPAFRFTASRAVYKGILKYLSARYNCPYTVQPLPVSDFSAVLSDVSRDGKASARLSWRPVEDPSEPTATASSFIVFTRMDDGGWDAGKEMKTRKENGVYSVTLPIAKGHLYSFRVVATNAGGRSFPSEVMSVGIPETEAAQSRVRVINDFHRVSGPVWFDTPGYAGFDNSTDSGVPYIRDWCFTGVQTEFERSKPYRSPEDCGFGASSEEYADVVVGGNTFDYPSVHGKALMKAGYAFDSCSSSAFASDSSLWQGNKVLDVICGKECEVRTGSRSPRRGGIFTPELMHALGRSATMGSDIMISGSYLGHDIFGSVYPGADLQADSLRIRERAFAREVLGYDLKRAFGSRSGCASWVSSPQLSISFPTKPVTGSYCVESPDALAAVAGLHGCTEVIMTYSDTGLPAALCTDFDTYKTAVFGFPLETISSETSFNEVISRTLSILEN